MSELLLARWQFGLTSAYHFLFVPLTLGLSLLVAIMETAYVRTGNDTYKKMTKFWGKLFVINFAMGVVTGIVLVFQFGMNWSEYSRFVGDIFGVPLAIEALLAFFLESTFLGIWIFGWDKISKKIHLMSIWLVAIASSISSLWILTANSFMQNPVSYRLTETKAELVNFGGLLTNSYLWHQFPHVLLGGFCTGAFFVLGVSAYHLLRKNDAAFFKKSFQIGIIIGLISVLGVVGLGHVQGQYLVKNKPLKMAAAEALWETADPAPFAIVASIDQEKRENSWEISIPAFTSFMAYNSFSGEVKGLRDLQAEYEAAYGPGDYLPPVTPVFWSFRLMVGAGSLMALLALLGIFAHFRGRLDDRTFLLRAFTWAIPLPFLANLFGWIVTEMGRQPWIVYGLQTVNDAVSPNVSAGEIWVTLIGFTVIYSLLALADLYLLTKYAKLGPIEIDISKDIQVPGEEVSLWT
ncbi:Cytochrome d ubiquinol oxidase, subunit I [Syntrophomonas zehnderi OL-4]|uniref:Cytochrome d ubiquinol oxidase, subunit I n=1 Tax=Syntrophomonas zehnderi OL-4 TaxID=690567 RepID=A0A0E4C7H0_9FIRM|nr:cytochrome ubiquinol oxidase subunit I [Syntrophomonas zehnderi]CFX01184.1 Cytochrome d ubiquinol oxidase, subunit I [Syntrophomonas zehnderi OL-4]